MGPTVQTRKRRDASAHSLLLNHRLIRVGVTLPEQAEFNISVVSDPYGCAVSNDPVTGRQVISVYRRPLPSSSLGFLSAIMWDGRETIAPLDKEDTFQANLVTNLKHQATDAVLGHSQAQQPPTEEQLAEI